MKNKAITDCIASNESGWDELGDYGDIQLYDAILEIDTKKFKKGNKIDCITFLFSQSMCQLYAGGNVIEEFSVKLVVV